MFELSTSLGLANRRSSKMSTPLAAGVDNVDKEIADAEVVGVQITDTGIADTKIVDAELADTEVAGTETPNAAAGNLDQLCLQPAPEGFLSLPSIGAEGSQSPLFLPSPVLEASAYHPKIVERDRIEVKVPPVEQRWEYRPYRAPKDNVGNFHYLFQTSIGPRQLLNHSSSRILVGQGNQAKPILKTGENQRFPIVLALLTASCADLVDSPDQQNHPATTQIYHRTML